MMGGGTEIDLKESVGTKTEVKTALTNYQKE